MTTTNTITLDMETAKLMVQAAAEGAAKSIAKELKEEIRSEISGLESRLGEKLESYFGRLGASDHIIQHNRIERFLNTVDRIGENVFGAILKNLAWGALIAAMAGYFWWNQGGGK